MAEFLPAFLGLACENIKALVIDKGKSYLMGQSRQIIASFTGQSHQIIVSLTGQFRQIIALLTGQSRQIICYLTGPYNQKSGPYYKVYNEIMALLMGL